VDTDEQRKSDGFLNSAYVAREADYFIIPVVSGS
jgi:hypothetical protein